MEGKRSVAAKSTKADAALAAASKAGDSPSCGFISGETEGWEAALCLSAEKRRNGKKRPNRQNRLFYSRALFFTLHFPYIKNGDGAYFAVTVLLNVQSKRNFLFCYVCMYSRFRNIEFFCGTAYRRVIFDDVKSKRNRPLFRQSLQTNPSLRLYLLGHIYAPENREYSGAAKKYRPI